VAFVRKGKLNDDGLVLSQIRSFDKKPPQPPPVRKKKTLASEKLLWSSFWLSSKGRC
jgi:hypothetical protein